MKQITVKNCGECPLCRDCYEKPNLCERLNKVVKPNIIDKDCPLTERVSREKAKKYIQDYMLSSRWDEMAELLDKLGFKE
jgi:hypothetical protein